MAKTRNLIFILGDQLSPAMSSLARGELARDVVLMAEVAEETAYVRHHKQKIALVFSAMRHFADELRRDGWRVDYRSFETDPPAPSFRAALRDAVRHHRPERVLVTEPGEWRVLEDMKGWAKATGLPVEILADTRFICSHERFARWAEGRKTMRMEHFYREMRRETGLLMEGDAPAGGRWNFDKDNRKPASADLFMPGPRKVRPDRVTRRVLDLVSERFADNFGTLDGFGWPVTRRAAEKALDDFIRHALPHFGDFQDAMLDGERFLYHSVLSPLINLGLLDPLTVCRAAERAWLDGHAPINAVEGFVRQIIGWREFVRGVYWREMPGYAEVNALGAGRDLPWFYWSGETDMRCVAEVVCQTREEAYAHHIQRLMVTGNFALLAGVEPRQIHEWYLVVYADAYEWVELPNVIGMSQFADGGVLGSKPYAASGAYIDRMSDHCGQCRYDVRKRVGEDACPFNALYWDFLARNRATLGSNPRLRQIYRNLDRMKPAEVEALRAHAAKVLDTL